VKVRKGHNTKTALVPVWHVMAMDIATGQAWVCQIGGSVALAFWHMLTQIPILVAFDPKLKALDA